MNILVIGKEEWKSVNQFYSEITANLREKGVYQWDRYYPNRFIIKGDLKQGNLFGMHEGIQLVGAIVLDTKESKKYKNLQWADIDGKPLVIHRLGVHPMYQGNGLGKRLLQFAEEFALKHGHSSIRLDVYSGNPGALALYERTGYREVGAIRFPNRPRPYYCFEKNLKDHFQTP
jgi:ribosomal protein S18 acetylase RimI-like enzyme